ncbi:bZIP transcription factor 1 [Phytophthora citrophthora]|uniref:BZIP transcription factor 1 n=1 Tax=Phytophthora citrophthora TaxID=4793 RepID=A0AAD9LLS9_9STRA|nr:bZIP transcription factor 1 [Phytophthora citrophthora]
MNASTLNPPNSQAFSDTVIGHVVQRSSRQRSHEEDRRSYQPRTLHRQEAPYQRMKQGYPIDSSEIPIKVERDTTAGAAILSSVAGLIGATDVSSGRKRVSCLTSDLKTVNKLIASIQGTNHHITAELQQAVVAEALKKKIRHRERCRINQARYRERQMKAENTVEDAIAKLKSEIKDLETKSKDSSRIPTTPTMWALVSEYFRQFNYYVSSPGTLGPAVSKFLREMMAPDVLVGSLFGADAVLENWKLFSHYFEDVRMELKDMRMLTSDTLVAGTSTCVTITNKTLRLAFPHLIEDSGKLSPLAAKLLGQRLVMKGTVLFRWDSVTDKVVKLQSQTDMLAPMLSLLRSLEDVSYVFYKARITPECGFIRKS